VGEPVIAGGVGHDQCLAGPPGVAQHGHGYRAFVAGVADRAGAALVSPATVAYHLRKVFAACALAWTAMALELFRALQGVGGAVLFATATPLLRAEFSGPALARALGVAGGVLTDTLAGRAS
jgi:MFS family permease